MHTRRSIGLVDDLGQIVYDVAETFCLRRQWPLAEAALQLALQIAPALFDHDKVRSLLQATNRHSKYIPRKEQIVHYMLIPKIISHCS